jgi:hypothetical protein
MTLAAVYGACARVESRGARGYVASMREGAALHRARAFPPALCLALLCHAVLCGLYLARTPAHEGPDENDHCFYVHYLASTGERPTILRSSDLAGRPVYTESSLAHHPPLFYALLATLSRAVGVADTAPAWRSNPHFGQEHRFGKLKWDHGADERRPRSAEMKVLLGWRALSLLCGLVTLWLTHRLGRALFPGTPRVADAATLALACVPQWSFVHGCVDNGNLAAALSTAVLLSLASASARRDLGPRRGLALGVGTGLALLTKLTSLFLLPLLALAYARGLAAWPGRRSTLAGALACGAAIALLTGWFFAQNLALYGEALAMNAHARGFAENRVPDGRVLEYLTGMFPRATFTSCIAGFGWAAVPPPRAVNVAVLSLCGVAVIGWIARGRALARAAGAGLWLLPLTCVLVLASLVQFNVAFIQPQGRYLFPAFPAAGILVAAGCLAWLPAAGRLARAALIAAAAVLPAGGLAMWRFVFVPAMPLVPTLEDPYWASMVAGLRTPPSPARRTIELLEAEPPRFAWRDPGNEPAARYSVHAWLPTGQLVCATYEWFRVVIEGQEWTMPESAWRAIPAGVAVTWKVRRLPDRARGESVEAMPESAPRSFVRR